MISKIESRVKMDIPHHVKIKQALKFFDMTARTASKQVQV